MQCPKCQFQNPDDLKFCNECGQNLRIICPSCHSVNQLQSKFCGECGQSLSSRERMSPKIIQITQEGIDFNELVSQFERDILLKALKMSGGVKNTAAKLLHLNRTTLVEKIKRLNLTDGWVD